MRTTTILLALLVSGTAVFDVNAQNTEEMQKELQKELQEATLKAELERQRAEGRVVVAPSASWKPNIQIEKSLRDLYITPPGMSDEFSFIRSQDRTSSSLMLSKNFKEETVSRKTSFEVEKGQKSISFQVNGNCEKGEIQVLIKYPSGKKLQEVVIDPSARIQWSKTLVIVEEDRDVRVVTSSGSPRVVIEKKEEKKEPVINEQYLGTWTIEVSAKNATGDYAVKIYTR